MTVVARVRGFPTPSGVLDLDVHRGDIVVVTGPNGSGKTSLLRALAGLHGPMVPQSVMVAASESAASDPRDWSAPALASHVALAPQRARDGLVGLTVAGEFRVRRGVPTAAHDRRSSDPALPDDVAGLADRDVATLSSGEARSVVLSVAQASHTPILLLDEPAEGLDAHAKLRLRNLVAARGAHAAVVAVDHSGILDDLATRRLHLGATRGGPMPAFDVFADPAGAEAVVVATPRAVRFGEIALRLPGLRLGRGVHAVVGANGSGKSTLLRRLSGLDPQSAAGVTLAVRRRGVSSRGRDGLPAPGQSVRFLLADARAHLTRDTVSDELRGIDGRGGLDGGRGVDGFGLVPRSLERRHPLTLSGGEGQRVALAKVLGVPAPLYLLDEPEAHLDSDGRRQLHAALARRVEEGACIVVATHDEGLAAAAHTVTRLEEP